MHEGPVFADIKVFMKLPGSFHFNQIPDCTHLTSLTMPPAFDRQDYWQTRFTEESSFEWLLASDAFLDILKPHLRALPPDAPILQLGSGTSNMHLQLRAMGFTDITNIDYAPLALEKGKAAERAEFGDVRSTYAVADALKLHLGRKYAIAIDKSTADSIACGGEDALLLLSRGVKRHLSDGGKWISLSYSMSRFDDPGIPLDISLLCKVPVKKVKETEPDVFLHCYLLQKR
jgi:hypothetical protein